MDRRVEPGRRSASAHHATASVSGSRQADLAGLLACVPAREAEVVRISVESAALAVGTLHEGDAEVLAAAAALERDAASFVAALEALSDECRFAGLVVDDRELRRLAAYAAGEVLWMQAGSSDVVVAKRLKHWLDRLCDIDDRVRSAAPLGAASAVSAAIAAAVNNIALGRGSADAVILELQQRNERVREATSVVRRFVAGAVRLLRARRSSAVAKPRSEPEASSRRDANRAARDLPTS